MKEYLRRNPIISFYLLAFGLSWLGWIPQTLHSRGMFPFDSFIFNILGAAGPTLAAVIVIWVRQGQKQVGDLFAALVRWRVSPGWFLFVFGYWFLAGGMAVGLMAFFGYQVVPLDNLPWISLVPAFILMLLSNVWEEIGWRGYALPRLQQNYSDRQIALLMGLLWSLWHLPLTLNPNSPMAGLPWFWELLFSLALTVIYTWLFNSTGGSLLLVSIFHAMSNTIASLLLEGDLFYSSYPFVVSVTGITALVLTLATLKQRQIASSIKIL